MKNNYPGNCNVCQTRVAAGAGDARKVDNRWIVLCSAHTAGTAVAAVALALVIRIWVVAGKVLCAPVSRLNDTFNTYLATTRSAGFYFVKADNAQVGTIDKAAGLINDLRAAGFTCDVAPDLVASMQASTSRATNDVTAANARAAEIDAMLRQTGKSLFPFQGTGVSWLAPRKKAILGDDMGLGKTVQALCAIPVGVPIVVVCPAVAKGVWVREAKRFRPDLTPIALDGRGSFRWAQPGEIVITNYAILPGEKAAQKGFPATLPVDLAVAPKGTVLISDEAHALKASGSHRTSQFRALRDSALTADGRVWLLTATPILNDASELWAVLQAMGSARDVFGSYENYKRMWNASEGEFGGVQWGRPSPEVAERLQTVMLRRMKRDVLPQLPPKTVRDIEVNGLSASTKKLCDAALAALEAIDVDLAKALAIASSTENKRIAFRQFSEARAALATAKLQSAIELVEAYEDAGEPVVVFSAHRAPIDVLGTRAGWAVITGDTSADKRTEIENAFQAGLLKGVACTIKAGGVAITLTKACNALFIDEEWTPALNAQAQDRVYRIGQSRGVVITRLVATHALDRRIAVLLAAKTEIITSAVDAASRDAAPVPTTAAPTVDTAALAADAKRAQDARNTMATATAALAAMLSAAPTVADDVEIAVSEECPF
jgi:SWI/SNF-related matrix-associated actin-dependent regulator 1 of chromatin subfamily A